MPILVKDLSAIVGGVGVKRREREHAEKEGYG